MSKPDYKALAKQYELEAEAYAIQYDDEIKPVRALIVMSGVLCQMESDLIVYERKQGLNGKSKVSKERLEILKSIYEDLSGLSDRNRRLKMILASNNARMLKMEAELETIKQQELNKEEFEQE